MTPAERLILRLLTQVESIPEELWEYILRVWVNFRGRLAWRNREPPPQIRGDPPKAGPWFLGYCPGRWNPSNYHRRFPDSSDSDDDLPTYRWGGGYRGA